MDIFEGYEKFIHQEAKPDTNQSDNELFEVENEEQNNNKPDVLNIDDDTINKIADRLSQILNKGGNE